jgi:RNA polymerase sigma factor (sigma-70 family)
MVRRPRPVSTIDVEPDHVLAQRAAEGDSTAFEELYRRHAPAAWRVAYAVAGNPDDAADAVSDAFTRVFQALPQGRLHATEQFRPYLLTSTRNAALDGLRRQGRLTPTATVETLDTPSSKDSADQVLDSVDSNLVAVAFRSLPERWRSVLWLTEVEGIPAREAAPG